MLDTVGLRRAAILSATGAFLAGILLAIHHPSHALIAPVAFVLWSGIAARWPRLWLFALPACLPAANLAPWTGWIIFDEFDLVILGAAAGGFVSLANRRATAKPPTGDRPGLALPVLCALALSLAVARGLTTHGEAWGWYGDYTDPLNALRVGKGPLCALLLLPLIREALRDSQRAAMRHIAAGMLTGLFIVAVAVIDERARYTGLINFQQAYRTTALFWEMHVGGAALDGYLALAWPAVAWAVLGSRTAWRWTASGAMVLLVEYAALTSFSRGLYLGLAGGLVVLCFALSRRTDRPPLPPWRRRADLILAAALLAQLVGVVGTESFMRTRVRATGDDFARRLQHWNHGIALLKSPTDWWFGRGAGRLPIEYAGAVPEDEFPGSARVTSDAGGAHLILQGTSRSPAMAGRYALTQQVPVEPGYHVAFDARVDRPLRLALSVCAVHLLHEGACQRAVVNVLAVPASWQHLNAALTGPPLRDRMGVPREVTFAVAVLDAATPAELGHVTLSSDRSANLLLNGDFSDGLAHWFPVATNYFVPWHIDNFYLELLIEQGLLGSTAVLLLLGSALATLASARLRDSPAAPYLAAALVGALLVGTVSSLLDVPRVAFLLFFLTLVSLELGPRRSEQGST